MTSREDPPRYGDPPRRMESPPLRERMKKSIASLRERMKKAIASGDHEEVARISTEGISLYPRNLNFHVARASANIYLKNYREAIADAANALLLDQGHRLLRALPYFHMGRALFGLGEFDHGFTIVSEGLKIDSADTRLTWYLERARVAATSKRATLGHSSGTDNIGDLFEGGEMWLKLHGDAVAREFRHDLEFQRKVSEARRGNLKLGEYLREDKRLLKAFEILLNVKLVENIGRATEPEAEIDGNIVPLPRKLSNDMIFAIVEYKQPDLTMISGQMHSRQNMDSGKKAKEQEEESEEEAELASELLKLVLEGANMAEKETEEK
ncbi:hypothetical protein MLD38_018410 [Melastoma candidum]|uniref:Uncharacterized protein n=1 Tax=Melastoma candidum TaxID=119954 RepID=A0ACB9QXS8_9MYRT|nr:hypothetical protein MLD38_018410 [Melastoma candidum]